MILALMFLAAAYGLVLTFWHRGLMDYLAREHYAEWEKLGKGAGPPRVRQIWKYSTRYPFWTWRSLGFFLFREYHTLGDSSLALRADRFRLAFLGWLLALAALTVFALYSEAGKRPQTSGNDQSLQRVQFVLAKLGTI